MLNEGGVSVMVYGLQPKKLWGYKLTDDNYTKLKVVLKEVLLQCKAKECICDMALGVPVVFADTVLELRDQEKGCHDMKLICAIPYSDYESKWYEADKARYQRILKKADAVIQLSEESFSIDLLKASTSWMVEKSDLAIVIDDGEDFGAKCLISSLKNQKKHAMVIDYKEIEKMDLRKGGVN